MVRIGNAYEKLENYEKALNLDLICAYILITYILITYLVDKNVVRITKKDLEKYNDKICGYSYLVEANNHRFGLGCERNLKIANEKYKLAMNVDNYLPISFFEYGNFLHKFINCLEPNHPNIKISIDHAISAFQKAGCEYSEGFRKSAMLLQFYYGNTKLNEIIELYAQYSYLVMDELVIQQLEKWNYDTTKIVEHHEKFVKFQNDVLLTLFV